MLDRKLEPEVMETAEDAAEYDSMDHATVNRAFVADLLVFHSGELDHVLDVGTGTALIPIELCQVREAVRVTGVDAAAAMLNRGLTRIEAAGLMPRIRLQPGRAQALPFEDGSFPVVVSNSLIHHVPEPALVFAEWHRVCAPGGTLFARDLLRPTTESERNQLVETYAAGATDYQRRLFADSLHAALTLAEVQTQVVGLGYSAETVRATSDRHWTWAARRV